MRIHLLYFIMLLFVAACERPVDLNLDEFEPQLAIVSNFALDQRVEVQVSKTQSPISTDNPEYVDNATVELYQATQLIERLTLIPARNNNPPFYISQQFTPTSGIEYTLKVQAPNFKPVEAKSILPAPTPIRALSITNVNIKPGTKPIQSVYEYEVQITFDDPLKVKNYYHLNFYQQLFTYRLEGKDTILTEQVFLKQKFNSATDDNTMISYFDGGVLFEDKNFNGEPISFSFPLQVEIVPSRQLLGNMYAELRTVSPEYYLYHNSLSRQQTSPGGPFSEPVIIYNNIENGQGSFAGYSPALDSIAIRY